MHHHDPTWAGLPACLLALLRMSPLIALDAQQPPIRELAPAWTMAARAQAASPWPVSYGVWVVAALMAFYVRYNGSSADTGGGITIDGASFPSELKMGGISQQLTGGGTRTKYGVAKVYAVALYVDTAAASSSLKKFASPKPIKDQKFFQALVDGTYSRTLFLQMLRGVAVSASCQQQLTRLFVPHFIFTHITCFTAHASRLCCTGAPCVLC